MAYATHAAFKLLPPAPESGSLNLDITNKWNIHGSLQHPEKAACFNIWAAWTCPQRICVCVCVCALAALPGRVIQAELVTQPKKTLNIYEDIINELLSTAGNNGHLNQRLLKRADWPTGITVMLNNPFSIEPQRFGPIPRWTCSRTEPMCLFLIWNDLASRAKPEWLCQPNNLSAVSHHQQQQGASCAATPAVVLFSLRFPDCLSRRWIASTAKVITLVTWE